MLVAVTGASGLIGTALVERLQAEGQYPDQILKAESGSFAYFGFPLYEPAVSPLSTVALVGLLILFPNLLLDFIWLVGSLLASLAGATLRGDFRRADFRGADLEHADLLERLSTTGIEAL